MRIGVFGYGSIGKRHCANISKLGHVVNYYDPACGHDATDRDALTRGADAIIICSPSKDHNLDIYDTLDNGGHFLCEKPFGYADPAGLDAAVQEARKTPRIMATGFNLRFHACVKRVKELIPSIGDIQFASFTVNQKTDKPAYLRDGILHNWCSHELDLANHLLGPGGKVVNCTLEGGDETQAAIITLKYPSVKEYVFIQADYYSDPERRHFFIEGTKGAIYVDLVQRNVFRSETDIYKNKTKKWQDLAATDTFDQNYSDEMQFFLMSVMCGVHQTPLATAEDGIAALYQVVDARRLAGLE